MMKYLIKIKLIQHGQNKMAPNRKYFGKIGIKARIRIFKNILTNMIKKEKESYKCKLTLNLRN